MQDDDLRRKCYATDLVPLRKEPCSGSGKAGAKPAFAAKDSEVSALHQHQALLKPISSESLPRRKNPQVAMVAQYTVFGRQVGSHVVCPP